MPNTIKMKQSYFDKLSLTTFVKANEDDKNLQSFQGLKVIIDNSIEEDYIIE